MEGTMDCGARSEEVRPAQKNAIYAPLCRSYLVGQNEQTGRKQLLREAVDGQWVFVGNGTNAHAEQNGGLSLGVLLKHDPAQHCAIERTKLADAFLNIEDKNDCVFEGADAAAGCPPPRWP